MLNCNVSSTANGQLDMKELEKDDDEDDVEPPARTGGSYWTTEDEDAIEKESLLGHSRP